MVKRIPYKTVSEQLQSKLQTMHHNYESLNNEVTILKNKLIIYEPYIDIIIKYNITDTNMLEDKLKKQIAGKSHDEKKYVNKDVDVLDELNIKDKTLNNASKNVEIKKIKEDIVNNINGNSVNNENNSKIKINPSNSEHDKTVSKDIGNKKESITSNDKVKVSDSIIKRIKNFYNSYKEDNFKIIFDNSEIDNIKNSINDNYEVINFNKSTIIYNNYLLYKKYLEAKKENKKLLFINFISEKKDVNRYSEKAKRCYEFFDKLINIVKDIPSHEKNSKTNIIIDVLQQCRLSTDKLYKIRNNNYNELINFLEPIIINKCKNKYEQN